MSKKKKAELEKAEADAKELDESTEAAVKESAKAKDKDKETALRDALHIRRTAKEVKKYTVLMRVTGLITVALIGFIAIGYAISYFYNKYGSFTIKVNKYDMVNQGLSLSETPEFDKTVSMLTADIVYDMTNISGEDLPDNIDKVNGNHNGRNYIAYMFTIQVRIPLLMRATSRYRTLQRMLMRLYEWRCTSTAKKRSTVKRNPAETVRRPTAMRNFSHQHRSCIPSRRILNRVRLISIR